MAKRLDFQELKVRVSVGDIIRHYGWDARQKGEELILRCVFHDDNHASLHWSPETFHCFGCHQKGGDIIDFVAAFEEVNLRQAALLIDGFQRVLRRQAPTRSHWMRLLH